MAPTPCAPCWRRMRARRACRRSPPPSRKARRPISRANTPPSPLPAPSSSSLSARCWAGSSPWAFLIGAVLSGSAGFIGMLVSVRANVRTAQASTRSLAEGLSMAFRAGAVTGLLVAGLALLGVAVYYSILTVGMRLPADRPHGRRLPGGARLRRLAHLHLRPSRRRHLHQGRRRRRRSRRQGRGRHPRGRSAQPRHHRRQRRRQRRRLRRHGGRPVRDLCRHGRGDHGAGGDLLQRPAGRRRPDALSARRLRGGRGDLDHRHLLRPPRRQPVDHGRALQGLHRHRRAVDHRACGP